MQLHTRKVDHGANMSFKGCRTDKQAVSKPKTEKASLWTYSVASLVYMSQYSNITLYSRLVYFTLCFHGNQETMDSNVVSEFYAPGVISARLVCANYVCYTRRNSDGHIALVWNNKLCYKPINARERCITQ